MIHKMPSMELKSIVEAILFAAQQPLTIQEIRVFITKPDVAENTELIDEFKKTKDVEISTAIEKLKLDYAQQGCSFQIQEVAGGFQLVSQPQFAPWLKQLFDERRSNRLSPAALETLAIIAYRQPITRADIESVRGVAVDGVVQTLLERGLISLVGRAEIPGRPILYGTTQLFLQHFGLNDINQLPAVEELRRIHLPTPKSSFSDLQAINGESAHVELISSSKAN